MPGGAGGKGKGERPASASAPRLGPQAAALLLVACASATMSASPAETPAEAATTAPGSTPIPTATAASTHLPTSALTDELRAIAGAARPAPAGWRAPMDVRRPLARFYEMRGFTPAFVRDGRPTEQARLIAGALADAERKGLDPADYEGARWGAWIAALDGGPSPPLEQARFDAALAAAAMRYAGALHRGRVSPRAAGHDVSPMHGPVDLAALLAELAASSDPRRALARLEPGLDAYRWLLEALARTRAAEARWRGEGALAVPRRAVEPGGSYAEAPRLAALLAATGDLPAGAEAQGYAPALAEAVARFQARHGLPPDGRLGRRTVEALNVPLSWRVRQIELALERWRWLPDELAEPPVVVNIPEYRLLAFEGPPGDLRAALDMAVIVGRDEEDRRTPVMARRIEQIVFAPYWEVPRRIAEEEILPRLEADPGRAERDDFVVEAPGGAVAPDAASIPLVREGKARLRQRPGPLNALGRVKFVLSGGDVYLHDTPTRALFARPMRALSHGCVRVADPVGLAAWVLRDEPGWDLRLIEEAMAGAEPTFVTPRRRPWVHAMYASASAQPDGQPRFAKDVYGLDRKLERALARASRGLR